MDVSSIGPSGLDPFSANVTVHSEQGHQSEPDPTPVEAAPLPEDSGHLVDTNA